MVRFNYNYTYLANVSEVIEITIQRYRKSQGIATAR